MQIMIDLETMGKSSSAPILSLGAVAFRAGEGISSSIHVHLSLCQQVDTLGYRVAADTALWWMDQDKDAQMGVLQGQTDSRFVGEALSAFDEWMNRLDPLKKRYVWANAPSFDCVILRELYRRVVGDGKEPWLFYNERCYRTMKNMVEVKTERLGVKHSALDDATYQAHHLMDIADHVPYLHRMLDQ